MQLVVSLFITSVIITGCGTSASTTSGAATSAPAMTGAYAGAETSDPEVFACANFALESRQTKGTLKLVTIISAEKQVVAGMNYKLKLSITDKGTPKTVNVVVWSKLDGTKEVTEWRD